MSPRTGRPIIGGKKDIDVQVDYTAEKVKFDANVGFSLSIFGLLCVALKLGFKFLVGWMKIKPDTTKK